MKRLRQEIIKIVSVPPKREGDTGYVKLTEEEVDKIVELFEKTIEQFIKRISEQAYREIWRIHTEIWKSGNFMKKRKESN